MFFCALLPGSPCLAPALGAIVGSREGGGEGAWSSSRLPVDLLVPPLVEVARIFAAALEPIDKSLL